MKVKVENTVEVSDEQRAAIASHRNQKAVTRAEIQEFIWEYGARWEDRLLVDGMSDDDLI